MPPGRAPPPLPAAVSVPQTVCVSVCARKTNIRSFEGQATNKEIPSIFPVTVEWWLVHCSCHT